MPTIPARPLTHAERETLDLLLRATLRDGHVLRAQAQRAKAVGTCACGCATIDLAVEGDVARWAPDAPSGRIASSAMSVPESPAHPALLLLHVIDGLLSEIEIVDEAGNNPQPTFPPVDTWRPAVVGLVPSGDGSGFAGGLAT